MKKIIYFSLLLLLLVNPTQSETTTIRVVGSNTVFPIMELTGARFQETYTDLTISIEGPGSGAGISALIDGQTDIAPMSRAPKDKEKEEASSKGLELNITTIALDALVIIINTENPINGLTSEEITKIYSGNVTSWTDMGWAEGGDITVIERDENSGTHDYFNDFFLDGKEVDPLSVSTHKQEASTSQLFKLVSDEKNAIGYGGLAYLDETVKAITVDGVVASKETSASGAYPVARPLFLVFDEKTISDVAREFVNYNLSPEGQFLVNEVGYVAILPMAESLSVNGGENNVPGFQFLAMISIVALVFIKKRK